MSFSTNHKSAPSCFVRDSSSLQEHAKLDANVIPLDAWFMYRGGSKSFTENVQC